MTFFHKGHSGVKDIINKQLEEVDFTYNSCRKLAARIAYLYFENGLNKQFYNYLNERDFKNSSEIKPDINAFFEKKLSINAHDIPESITNSTIKAIAVLNYYKKGRLDELRSEKKRIKEEIEKTIEERKSLSKEKDIYRRRIKRLTISGSVFLSIGIAVFFYFKNDIKSVKVNFQTGIDIHWKT